MRAFLLFFALAGCGSHATVRHDAAAGDQLNAIDAATQNGAGSTGTAGGLLAPTPDQVGQRMRAAAAKPPPR